jgi:hypothetical protein
MGLTLTLTPDEVSNLMAAVGAVAPLPPRNGFFYDGSSVLSVPDAYAAVVEGIIADPGWKTNILRTALALYAASKRWQTATAGTTAAGIALATDDASQAKIGQLKQAFDTGAISSAIFKAADGQFHTVTAAQATAIYNGVVAHVQACYAAEAAAAAAIASGAATTQAQVDAFFAGIP